MTEARHGRDAPTAHDERGVDARELVAHVARRWRALLAALVVGGAAGVGASFAMTPTFVATNVFLPPQQQQGGASAALASLGALSSLVGGGGGTRNSADQFIALMESATVSDRILQKFDLLKVYGLRYRMQARKVLARHVQISAGKKDGLIRVEVEDTDPARAAAMANQYVEELGRLTGTLAVSEAQQRRVFFERLLEQTRDKLAAAQTQLEASGFTEGALKSEPRSAADGYARLRADLTMASVKLQVLKSTLADTAPAVLQQQETVNAIQGQLARLEAQESGGAAPRGGDYVNRYREYKYQDTLFQLFARQYEAARVDESREGELIQVVDAATPPELKTYPHRSVVGALGAAIAVFGCAAILFVRRFRQLDAAAP